ncbi:MAG: tetrahydromethanopterin S-methyltransferase subunit D, partial [Methanosarcinales archaeon]|nr:tetrahydromethanopterin S-methyltransferase subunit D [Methanosarcinales archaeon]
MTDFISLFDPISIILITIGGILIGLGVHFIPVGGAPAAMAQATGVGTGT